MHLICSECLTQWQNKDSSQTPTCPFCRCDIKGYEKIKIKKKAEKDPTNSETAAEGPPEEPPEETAEQSPAEQTEPEPKPQKSAQVKRNYIRPNNQSGAVNMAFEPDPVHTRFEIKILLAHILLEENFHARNYVFASLSEYLD